MNIFLKIPYDKALHYISGQVGVALMLCLAKALRVDMRPACAVSFAIVLVIALLKEVNDAKDPHNKFDPWDATATVLGGVPLWALALL